MAIKLVKYPKANMIHFVPEKGVPPEARHDFLHYDNWWMSERRKPSDANRCYYQKLEQSQRISLMFHSNNAAFGDVEMDIYNSEWQLVDTVVASSITIPGYEIYDSAGNAYTANTHIISQFINLLSLPDGFYYFRLRIPFATEVVNWLSEIVWIRDVHPKTMRFDYTHSENEYDMFYAGGYGLKPTIRVESAIHSLTPNSDSTTYIDEKIDVTPLYDVPYDTFTLTVQRVPEWMVSKINRATSHDTWSIYDGDSNKSYVKAKDAKWEVSSNINDPLKSMSITIQEAQNEYSQSSESVDPILVWEANMNDQVVTKRFPYFVRMATLNRTDGPPVVQMLNLLGSPSPYPYTWDCKEVKDEADEQYLLDFANNVTKPFYGQQGYYDIVVEGTGEGNAHMYYYPAPFETGYTGSNFVVLTKHVIVSFQNGAYNTGQFYDVKGSWIGYALLRSDNSYRSAGYGSGNPTVTHLVGGSSINLIGDVARIYHYRQNTATPTVSRIVADYATETPNIKAISGVAPSTLELLTITSGVYFTSWNWVFAFPCKAVLYELNLSGNRLSAVLNTTNYAGQQLAELEIYELSNNTFPSVGVDSVLNSFYNGGGGNEVYGNNFGEIYIDDQTPPAPPTGSSAAAIAGLNADSWVTITD